MTAASAAAKSEPIRPVRFGPHDTRVDKRADGSMVLLSPHPLAAYPAKITERLRHWAGVAPERVFVAERGPDRAWITLTYRDTLARVRAIAEGLVARALSEERTIAILSDNTIEHLLLALAAQYAGVPYGPISSAYSLASGELGKLKHVLGLLTPGLVFAQSGSRFAHALQTAVPPDAEIVVVDDADAAAEAQGRPVTSFADLASTTPTDAVDLAYERVDADTIAKILFTSGSTGNPKGVINTQRMICANQQQILQSFPFLGDAPPVIVDWLVWNHTFGGNHNVGMMLYNGGSLYIDDGKPTPNAIGKTVANLREIAPTLYFNVPKGFEELIPYFRREPGLREKFFSNVQMLFYAGAGMPQHVWDAWDALAVETIGQRIVITTGLGCTESGPSALFANWAGGFSGLLGTPVPGLELKLAPSEDKLEARYRGPNVMPGYWRQPEQTVASFDEEGFYRTGDALRFVDPARPDAGMVFDGRIAEDFKLRTGTWVSVGTLRAKLIAAASPLLQDAVIAGHDQDFLSAILFANPDACRALAPDLPAGCSVADAARHPRVRAELQAILDRLAAQSTGSATRITRALIAEEPASLDAGEITDKGSLNQRAVLRHRTALVDELYRDAASPRVLVVKGGR